MAGSTLVGLVMVSSGIESLQNCMGGSSTCRSSPLLTSSPLLALGTSAPDGIHLYATLPSPTRGGIFHEPQSPRVCIERRTHMERLRLRSDHRHLHIPSSSPFVGLAEALDDFGHGIRRHLTPQGAIPVTCIKLRPHAYFGELIHVGSGPWPPSRAGSDLLGELCAPDARDAAAKRRIIVGGCHRPVRRLSLALRLDIAPVIYRASIIPPSEKVGAPPGALQCGTSPCGCPSRASPLCWASERCPPASHGKAEILWTLALPSARSAHAPALARR
jgi:hypothetical protein